MKSTRQNVWSEKNQIEPNKLNQFFNQTYVTKTILPISPDQMYRKLVNFELELSLAKLSSSLLILVVEPGGKQRQFFSRKLKLSWVCKYPKLFFSSP